MAIDCPVEIRAATHADAARIKIMVRAERLNPLGLDWQRFYVAEGAGEVVACVQTKPHGNVRELASLVVECRWRGLGIGLSLVAFLQAEAGPPLWLMCRTTLVPFYEQCGFEEVAAPREMPRYFAAICAIFNLSAVFRLASSSLAIMVWRG